MSDPIWHAVNGKWKRLGSNPVEPGRMSNKPLVGAALNQTTPEAWATFEAQVGTLLIRRSYAAPMVFPATFAASTAGHDIGKRESMWSFKPDPPVFAAGGNDVWFNSFLDSIPSGHKTIIILWHEPEEELLNGSFTLSEWQAANNRMGQLVHAKGRPELRSGICTMGPWDFNTSNPAYYTEFWHADFATNIDYVGFDPYNFTDATYLDLQPNFLSAISWAQAKNKPIIIPEWGGAEDPGGDVTKKAQFIQHMYDYFTSIGCYAVLYFNNSNGTTTVPLYTSPQAMAAFASINAHSKTA